MANLNDPRLLFSPVPQVQAPAAPGLVFPRSASDEATALEATLVQVTGATTDTVNLADYPLIVSDSLTVELI